MARADAGRDDGREAAGADARYHTICEHLPDLLVVVFDRDLRVELATGAALRDLGRDPDELVGRRLPEAAPAPMAERLPAVLAGERQAFEQPGWWDPERVWAVEAVAVHDRAGAVAGGIAFARDVTERHRVERVIGTDQDITELKQAEQERQRLLGRLYEVLEGQHQQLAADLHDSHVQNLAAIGLKLDQVRLRLGPGTPAPVRARLDELREDVRTEVAALRRTIGALRPLVLDQRGLEAALRGLAATVCLRATLVSCAVVYDLAEGRLLPAAETALFRVVQQALANVEQHAAARHVRVELSQEGPVVVLHVEDDGRGFDPVHAQALPGSGGFGLTVMRERVQALGGDFTVSSGAGKGTRIQARVPTRPATGAGP